MISQNDRHSGKNIGNGSVLSTIRSSYASLNAAERRVADFVLNNQESVKGVSVMRIGELSGVGQTTVVRFCRLIGFEGYRDFKMALIEELAPRRNAFPEEHSDVQSSDDLSTLVEKVLAVDMQAIRNASSTLDIREFSRSMDALISSSSVEILASGTSMLVALGLYYRLLRSGINCRLGLDSHMQTVNASLLMPGDIAFAISYSGESDGVVSATSIAKKTGATTICITNFPDSSLARLCDIRLISPLAVESRNGKWLDDALAARLAQLSILDALCVAVCREKETDAFRAKKHIDTAADRLHSSGIQSQYNG